MMKIKVVLFLCLLCCITACRSGKKNSAGNHESADASVSIQLDDAKDFLPSWSKENTLVYHVIAEPGSLHPINGNSQPNVEISLYTQMFLVTTDYENQGLAPGVIKSLPSLKNDHLEYTYELREEPRWDDGSPLTVDDLIFTCKAVKCPLTNNPHVKPYWDNLAEIKTDSTNPRKFTFVMKQPYIHNIGFLSDCPVLQRSFFDSKNILSEFTLKDFDNKNFKPDEHKDLVEWSNEFNNEKYGHDLRFLTGLGMYKLENWEQGQYITLVKKKNHWTQHSPDYHEFSYPDKIIFKLNKDDNSQMLEFKSQAMDASANVSAKTLMTLKENEEFNKNYHSLFTLSYNYTYIAMNEKPDGVNHKNLFDDQKVRKAMAFLTPVDHIISFVYKQYSNQCRREVSNVSPLKKDCDHDLQPVPPDLEKAKQLLDEAGWKDTDADGIRDKMIHGEKVPLSFTFQFLNTAGDWKEMAAMIAEEMSKAGVKVNLLPLDLKIFVEKARNHDFDMMMGVWGGSSQNEDFTQLWHTGSWISKGSNYSGFGTLQSDALIDSIKMTLDDAKRIEMSKRLQRMIYDDQPYIFLYASLRRNIIHKRFGNVNVFADRPGILLNTLKLLPGKLGIAMVDGVDPD
ncbi:MAG: ABC transporter substrate-binding protein [Bacteroidetes bacterium]|nr:ABC transporter substrate-binding protein [Bacteroidota bacterium]